MLIKGCCDDAMMRPWLLFSKTFETRAEDVPGSAECNIKCKINVSHSSVLFHCLQAGDSPRFTHSREELEEWKACTFLLDGIILPINRTGGNWKIIPQVSRLE